MYVHFILPIHHKGSRLFHGLYDGFGYFISQWIVLQALNCSRPLQTCYFQNEKCAFRRLEQKVQTTIIRAWNLTLNHRPRLRVTSHILSRARVERPVNGIIFFFRFWCVRKTSYKLLTPDPRGVVSVRIFADIIIDHINVKVIFQTRNGKTAE